MHTDRLFGQVTQYVKRKSYVAMLLLTAPALAVAAVPNIFSNGQPADAVQVNENFDNLDGRLAALEGLGLPPVTVDCDANADALQDAIDAAPPRGEAINVSGTCNSISIFGKLNLIIDGQGITTILGSNTENTLDIGASPLVIISGVTVDANNMGESAVRVGASTVIFTDLTAFNTAGEASVGISTNGVAIFNGSTEIGAPDPNNPGGGWALEMDERATLLAEGDIAINGKVDMADFSFFDQDSQGNSGNILNINGDMKIGPASRMEVENGALNGQIEVGGGSFLARPGGTQTLSINGGVSLVRSTFVLDGSDGGTISQTGGDFLAQFGSFISWDGAGTDADPARVDLNFSSQMVVKSSVAVDSGTIFQLLAFSSLYSETVIAEESVTCTLAQGFAFFNQTDLCPAPEVNDPT